MKVFFTSVSLCALASVAGAFIGTASAADLPLKAVKAPPMIADPWTGWYGGVNIGGAIERNCPTQGPPGGIPVAFNLAALASIYTPCNTGGGVIGGGQIGFNKQVANWVWGFEADIDGLSTQANKTRTFTGSTRLPTETVNNSTDMLATFRGRVGTLVTPTTLVYVTGGMAMAHVNTSASLFQLGPTIPPLLGVEQAYGSNTKFVPGWTIGAGGEWKLSGNWSVKAEYLYVNLGAAQFWQTNQNQANVGLGVDNDVPNISVPTQLHILRLGANYKFGAPSESNASAAMGPVAYNWTGLYFGGNVGGAWGHSRSMEPSTPIDTRPFAGNWEAPNHVIDTKANGFIGGAQAGYNWQANAFVFGFEGDLGYMNFKGNQVSDISSGTSETSTGGYYGMFRARLGYAVDRALFYGTGGLMVADVNAHVDSPLQINLGDQDITSTRTTTQAGWTAGGGVEYGLNDGWSLKGEYLHFDLGSQRVIATSINGIGGPYFYAFDIKNSGDIVRFGFNKKIF